MLKRSDIKKMYVWDDYNSRKRKRYVLFKNCDGSCVVVSSYYENKFKKGEYFDTTFYDHCEPIPEPKKRIMTRNEVLKFVLENHDKILVRYGLGKYHILSGMCFDEDIRSYSYIFIDELGNDEQPKRFEIEVTDE